MSLTRFNNRLSIPVLMILLMHSYCFGQQKELNGELINYSSIKNRSIQNSSPEKLYIQFDKPYYAVGDTLWLKGYLLNATSLSASDKSGIMYLDITNDSNRIVKQYKFNVQKGLTTGSLFFDEKTFIGGTYIIHAYTNWMRNFGEDCFFSQRFYLSSTDEHNWLISTNYKTSTLNGSKAISSRLFFSDINKAPYTAKPVTVEVMNGSKRLYKGKLQTSTDGVLDVNFNFPEKPSNITMVVENDQDNRKAVIPVVLNNPENIDVQFLPEGGELVAGLPAHIGFKAVGEDGKSVPVSGVIVDSEQKQVASFQSQHNGMGSFYLNVKPGETYTAKVTLGNGASKELPLPSVKSSGTVLQVKNQINSDSLDVFVATNNEKLNSDSSYFLIGKSRGIVCYAAIVDFQKNNFIKKKISKRLFPTGITHFMIMTTKLRPLNERLTFVEHHDELNIRLIPNSPDYSSRDSISLKIKVTDHSGIPVTGNFSLAATDDSQVKIDTDQENLRNRMLFTADLKGYIEQPGYYFSVSTAENWQALDNLLLTQGWVSYNRQEEIDRQKLTYQPEPEFLVKGRVVNVFNKPVKGTQVFLFSKSPQILMDTLTNDEGEFVFNHFPRVDTPIFTLKAVNKNGKDFNVGIKVDEGKLPDFKSQTSSRLMPWYTNSDTTLITYVKNSSIIEQQKNFLPGKHALKEVKITGKKTIKGSQNLNGSGEADIVLGERDLEAAGKKTWLQLLEENNKSFTDRPFNLHLGKDEGLSEYVTNHHISSEWYFIDSKPVELIVDGISVTQVLPIGAYPNAAFIEMRNYLKTHTAEDIKGMEIMHSTRYAAAYFARYDPGDIRMAALEHNINIGQSDISFVEITTRSGHGPLIDNSPGLYLYKPLPISYPKEFYKPKYAVEDTTAHLPDLRSTIDWEPNITTDANGEARVWFYAADKPSTYTIIIEGTDMNGRFGYKTGKIEIVKSKTVGK